MWGTDFYVNDDRFQISIEQSAHHGITSLTNNFVLKNETKIATKFIVRRHVQNEIEHENGTKIQLRQITVADFKEIRDHFFKYKFI